MNISGENRGSSGRGSIKTRAICCGEMPLASSAEISAPALTPTRTSTSWKSTPFERLVERDQRAYFIDPAQRATARQRQADLVLARTVVRRLFRQLGSSAQALARVFGDADRRAVLRLEVARLALADTLRRIAFFLPRVLGVLLRPDALRSGPGTRGLWLGA